MIHPAYPGHTRFLPYLLNRTTSRLNLGFQLELHRRKLTLTQWRVLAFLCEHDGLPVSQLADRTATDQSTLSRALSRMQTRSWITRRSASEDSRVSEVSITPRGRRLFETILPVALTLEAQAFRDIDSRSLEQFTETLQRILRNLDQPPVGAES